MKSPSSPLSSRWRLYALCGLSATLISLGAWHIGWTWGALLDNVAHDAGFRVRSPLSPATVANNLPRSSAIVFVGLPHEIPRPILAKLISHLSKARVVALDLMLVDRASELSTDERPLFDQQVSLWKREDKALASAMKNANNVVIGAWPELATDGSIQWTLPSPLFEQNARATTHFGVLPDEQDGSVRRLHLWENEGLVSPQLPLSAAVPATDTQSVSRPRALKVKPLLPAMSLEVAALATGKTPTEVASPGGKRELWINYLGPRAVFEENHLVFSSAMDYASDQFNNKIVFVGETSFRSKDVFITPCGAMPGLFLHANATATLLDGRGTPSEVPLWGIALLSLGAALLLVVPLTRWSFPLCALVALGEIAVLVVVIAGLWASWDLVAPLSVPALAVFLTYNSVALLEYARARRTLGRVVGRTMAGRLLEARSDPSPGGMEEVATAFFCDLRGFSSWAQTRTPQQLITDLNSYTTTVVQNVEIFGGRTIDFFGDGVFVLFEGPQHARRGIQAALAVSKALNHGSQTKLQVAVALDTGTMVIGLVGHANHFKPGAVGEAVNIASRVQSLSEDCGFAVLMTRRTLDAWRADNPNSDSVPLIQPIFCGAHLIKGYAGVFEVFGLGAIGLDTSQKIC